MKKKILIYALIVLTFVVLSYGFVPQLLSGKIVNQSDISGWSGMAQEAAQWNKAHPDDMTQWSGSMFGGMPTISFQTPVKGDLTQVLYNALMFFKRPASYLFISLLGAFLLMLALGISPIIAAGGAVAVTFCSYNLQIIQVGHNTKMQAIAFLPWVLASLIFCYRSAVEKRGGLKEWLPMTVLGAALFGLTLSFQIKANHPQISYYLAILIILYALVLLVWLLSSPERRSCTGRFFIASALLLVMGCCGIGTNATKLIPTWEYTEYSMRGGSQASSDKQKGTKGLDLDYATAWSYGWEELPNLMIPNFNGGSSAGAVNPDKSETYALLKRAGQPNLNEVSKNLPLYWGPQPFTAGPMYMGAITVFLFILGLFIFRGKEKWWLVIATVLAVFLALGNHFLWFTKLFYDYVPLYSKFRTVSMALTVLQFTLPVLAFLTLDRMVRNEEFSTEFRKKGWWAVAITAGFCLLCAVIPGIAGSFYASSDAGQPEILAEALAADRRYLLVSDAWRSLFFILAAFAALWWGSSQRREQKKGSRSLAAVIVCVLVLVDLFSVGHRYLNEDDFISPRNFKAQFDKRPVDEMILEDRDPSYRVLDLTVSVFNDSHPSYWHKNIGGYSPAKLQIYQEYIDSHLSSEINKVYSSIRNAATVQEAEDSLPYLEGLASLNCRYIIVGENNPPLRYRYARGNAWFEDGTPIEMTEYAPNELRYRYNSETGGKAVFSEVFYPAGWVARVDGKEYPIYLSDELFRAIDLPAGEHEVVMRFEPSSYALGENVSLACSVCLLLLVLLSIAGMLVFKTESTTNIIDK